MNLFERAAARFLERRNWLVSQDPPENFGTLFGGADTSSGVQVTEQGALQMTAVFACVRILSETVASLPLILYERLPDGGKARATEYPLYSLLHDAPNPEMTSFELRETLMGHVATWGNAYAEIETDRNGSVMALWPLRPDRMTVERVGTALVYSYRLTKADSQGRIEVQLPADRVLHIRGLGFDGIMGYSPIALARQAVGLGMATEKFGASFFGNGARPGGVLEHPGKLGPNAYKNLRETLEQRHGGIENAMRLMILEEGMKYTAMGIPPEDAQFLETRKFQVNEIARLYRVPPHMVGDLDRATFSNVEQQSIDFVIHTIRPWLVRWEQGIAQRLLLSRERSRYFAEFLVEGLLRGDTLSRYQSYAIGRQWGWLSADDIRERENMDPLPEDEGKMYLVPLNMVPADQVGQGLGSSETTPVIEAEPEPEADPDEAEAEEEARAGQRYEARARELRGKATERHRLEQVQRPVYAALMARALRRERNDVSQAAKKLLQRSRFEFDRWMEDYYAGHQRWMFDEFMPVAQAYAGLVTPIAQEEAGAERTEELPAELLGFIRSYLAAFVVRHAAISHAEILKALERAIADNEDLDEALRAALERWPEVRGPYEAQEETVRFGNAIAVTVFALSGVRRLRWIAFGESCPYCKDLDGRIVGIEEAFLKAGIPFQPGGAESALTPGNSVHHAPAHDRCDCTVTVG